MTAMEFARRKGVTYETVLDWLKRGLVPGAVLKKKGKGRCGDIPTAGLQVEYLQKDCKKT
jgi:hypothetical protein